MLARGVHCTHTNTLVTLCLFKTTNLCEISAWHRTILQSASAWPCAQLKKKPCCRGYIGSRKRSSCCQCCLAFLLQMLHLNVLAWLLVCKKVVRKSGSGNFGLAMKNTNTKHSLLYTALRLWSAYICRKDGGGSLRSRPPTRESSWLVPSAMPEAAVWTEALGLEGMPPIEFLLLS